jgi:hypothetical protein
MFIKIGKLPPPNTSYDITHPIVVSNLTMLVMRGRVPGLGGPEPDFLDSIFVSGKKHPTTAGGDDLVTIEPSAS